MDSMQASLEVESKGKTEALRIKKKLEQDINELEIALDASNRIRAEIEKNNKRFQQSIKVRMRNVLRKYFVPFIITNWYVYRSQWV